MAIVMDLHKASAALKLSLEKAGVVNPPEVEVGFNLDVSGSFEDEHLDGSTNDILARLVPWGLVFDPDKKLDVFTFSDGRDHAYYVGEVTADNYEGYVSQNIIGKVPGWNRGTDYAHVLRLNLEHFGWRQPARSSVPEKSGGMFGGFFGSKKNAPAAPTTVAPTAQRKSLILHVTDGDNSDKHETMALLEEMEKRGDQVYVQFFGMSNQRVSFDFLKKVADRFSNTGLYVCHDIAGFIKMTDDQINELIIQPELIEWLKK